MEAKTHQKTDKKNRIREGARKETEGRMEERGVKNEECERRGGEEGRKGRDERQSK